MNPCYIFKRPARCDRASTRRRVREERQPTFRSPDWSIALTRGSGRASFEQAAAAGGIEVRLVFEQ